MMETVSLIAITVRRSALNVKRPSSRKRFLSDTFEPTQKNDRLNVLSVQKHLRTIQILKDTCDRTRENDRSSVPNARRILHIIFI